MNTTLNDIFNEDDKKKKTRLDRKMEKKKKQEEQIYDDFIKEQKNVKKTEKNVDEIVTNKIDTKKHSRSESDKEKKGAKSIIYDIFFAFITILSFFISIGYVLYNYLKEQNQNQYILGGILIGFTFFYMLTMFSKKEGFKKFFGILTSLTMMGFIMFQLFIL